jgi:hypothetical protein
VTFGGSNYLICTPSSHYYKQKSIAILHEIFTQEMQELITHGKILKDDAI